jgi:hypothetical protein
VAGFEVTIDTRGSVVNQEVVEKVPSGFDGQANKNWWEK